MSIKDQFIVRSIESSQTYEWFLHKHYAKRIPNISYSFGLYDRNKFLKGVCSFAKPMSHTLVQGALGGKFTDTFLELNRLVVNDNLEKNTLSFFVSQSLMLLPKPHVVVSYADSSYHHHGYIYQATNWIYTGLSSKFTDYAVKGLEHLHHSSIEDSVGRYDKDKNINKHQLQNYIKESMQYGWPEFNEKEFDKDGKTTYSEDREWTKQYLKSIGLIK